MNVTFDGICTQNNNTPEIFDNFEMIELEKKLDKEKQYIGYNIDYEIITIIKTMKHR